MSKSEPSDQARRQIDDNLRRVFQEQLEEELPDRFRDLLDKLKRQDVSKDKRGS